MTGKRIDSEEERVVDAIARIAGEVKAPLAQLALKKLFGLAHHDIRLRLTEGETPIYILNELWKDDSMFDEKYWRLPLKARSIQLYCVSDTEPVVTSVTMFAKIPDRFPALQFIDSQSRKNYAWSRDFWNDRGVQISQAPVLKKGAILNVTFSENARIGPTGDLLNGLLKRAKSEKEAVEGYLIQRRFAQSTRPIGGSNLKNHVKASSSKTGEELDILAGTLLTAHRSLEVSAVVTLVDSTLMPFKWDDQKGEFCKGFFTVAITVK